MHDTKINAAFTNEQASKMVSIFVGCMRLVGKVNLDGGHRQQRAQTQKQTLA